MAKTPPLSATNIVRPSALYATLVNRGLPSYKTFVSFGPNGATQLTYRMLVGCGRCAAG
jgi:hypothetical protein